MLNSLDTSRLSTLLLILMVLLVIAAIVIVRFVSQATRRLVWLSVVCFMLLGSYMFRADLGTCSQTCDCKILARDINVPTCVAGRTQTANNNNNTGAGAGDNNVGTGQVRQTTTTTAAGQTNQGGNDSVLIDGANETVRPGP